MNSSYNFENFIILSEHYIRAVNEIQSNIKVGKPLYSHRMINYSGPQHVYTIISSNSNNIELINI